MLQIHEPQKIAIGDVNFAAYNPRVMPADEMDALKASMLEHGLVLNLVVQKRGMTLIGGHQRVRALRAICEEQGEPMPEHAWATVLDVDDVTAKRLNVALNKIAGEFDPFRLGELMRSLGELAHDDSKVLAMGFRQQHVDELLALVAQPNDAAALIGDGDAAELPAALRTIRLTIDFPSEAERDDVREYLSEIRKARNLSSLQLGSIVCELVRAARNGVDATAVQSRPAKSARRTKKH